MLHAANMLQATGVGVWGQDAPTIWWLPPGDERTRLTVAHYEKGGPVYDDALSKLGRLPGPLLLQLPAGRAAALRREMDGHRNWVLDYRPLPKGSS